MVEEDVCGVESEADDEGIEGEVVGDDGERLGLEKEDEVVRHIRDPKLPSQDDIDRHWIMGHLPYRNCLIVAAAR